MTRTLLKLHVTLWRRSFRGDPSLTFMTVFIVIFGLIGVLTMGGLSFGMIVDHHDYRTLPLTMATGVIAYLFIVFLLPSSENQLSAKKFAALPLTSRELMPGLTLASILQSRGVLAFVNSLIMAAFGSAAILQVQEGAAGTIWSVLWIIACIAQALIAVLLGEAIASLLNIFAGRKWSERLGIFFTVIFLAAILGMNILVNSVVDYSVFLSYGTALGWTPFGAAAGALASGIEGNIAIALPQLVITTVTIVGGIALWRKSVQTQLRRPLQASSAEGTRGEHELLVRWASPTPRGAVYSRMLRYLLRDTRYTYNAVSLPAIAIMLLVLGTIQDSGFQWYAPIMVAQASLVMAGNDYGYDGPANWVHMVSGIRAKDMIKGRIAAMLSLNVPMTIVASIALGALEGVRPLLFVVAFFALCVLVQGAGLSVLTAVRFPYPTSRPGTNPMKDKSGYSGGAFFGMLFAIFGLLIPLIPGAIMLLPNLASATSFKDATLINVIGVVVQLLISLGLGFTGYCMGVRQLEPRWPAIFDKVRNWS